MTADDNETAPPQPVGGAGPSDSDEERKLFEKWGEPNAWGVYGSHHVDPEDAA